MNGRVVRKVCAGASGVVVLTALALALAPVGATVSQAPAGGTSVRIASAQPLTGFAGFLGPGLRDAVQLAIDEHGPVKGFPVEHAVFDSGCADEAMAVGAASDIVADGSIVAVVGESCSAFGESWIPVFESAGVPIVSPTATRPSLPQYGPTVFNRVVVSEPDDEAWYAVVAALPSVADFQDRFEARYGTPATVFAELAYDAAWTILAALDRVARVEHGSLVVDRARLARAIRATDGLLGVTCKITFDELGNRQNKPQQLARCADV